MILTAPEAAKLLRIRLDRMYELLETGEVPAYKEGKAWKIPRGLLEEHINQRALKEAAERRAAK